MAIRRVGVVGCGLMGSGIAQVSAQAGFPTVVREVSPNALERGLRSIRTFLQEGLEKGKVTAPELERTLANLRGTVELRDLADYVGLDSSYAIAGIMFDDFREARFAPPPLLKRMVVAGLFGRKSGRGFYDWSTNPPS